VIAVDTNILVYAHRRDSEWHETAYEAIRQLAEGPAPWAVAWPCFHEFLAIVTHPRIYNPPTPLEKALAQVEIWSESPTIRILSELKGHWKELKEILSKGRIVGAAVHDARVAAICQEHGVQEIWTADRDFTRVKGVTIRNPLLH
jgi:toxin-antitoxin system PIN domain toxin